jgi:hypothetical protein
MAKQPRVTDQPAECAQTAACRCHSADVQRARYGVDYVPLASDRDSRWPLLRSNEPLRDTPGWNASQGTLQSVIYPDGIVRRVNWGTTGKLRQGGDEFGRQAYVCVHQKVANPLFRLLDQPFDRIHDFRIGERRYVAQIPVIGDG